MKIFLSGGGTMGSVSPLITIYEEVIKRDPNTDFLWLATKKGPEVKLLEKYDIPVKKILSGKWRRYWSIYNFIDPFLIILAFFQACFLIIRHRPSVHVSAGGFVSVPVCWAAKLFGCPTLIHQQDVVPGLANKLMAPIAKKITVNFESSLNDFSAEKTVKTGNPVRKEIGSLSKDEARLYFGLDASLPVLLIIGGGTGAYSLNKLALEAMEEIVEHCQVIHITGGKVDKNFSHQNYHNFDFMTDLHKAYAAADMVVTRAGMSVLSELAKLGKACVAVPMPGTHQEQNAYAFYKKNAVIIFNESNKDSDSFAEGVIDLLNNENARHGLEENISRMHEPGATVKIVDLLYEIARK